MSYSVATLKQDLNGILHGTTTNKITGLNNLINRAARTVLLDIDPQETIRIAQIGLPLNDSQYEYPAPADLKGDKICDIRPQVDRGLGDIFVQRYNQQFDVEKEFTLQDNFTINFNGSVKSLRIDAPSLNTGIQINAADAVTDNGTWITGGNASNISQDTVNFVYTSGSIQFDLSAGGAGSTGYLENSTMSAIDLSTHDVQSIIYFWVYLPTAANFSNVIIRWGSSATAYWTATATSNSDGNAFVDGWNLCKATWATATKVGAPVDTAVNYLRITYTYNGTAMNGNKLNQVISRKGLIFQIQYYSKYLFRDSTTNAFQETVTDDTNLINFDTETFNILTNQVALLCVQQSLGQDAKYDTDFFTNLYNLGIQKYKNTYKSQLQKPQAMYYSLPNPSYRQYFNRTFR